MLLTRAIRLINVTRIRPAHARIPHPTWVTAIKRIFRCCHPQAKCLYLKSTFPHLAKLTDSGSREVHIYGFSAGSFTGLALHEILTEYSAFPGRTKVAAIAAPPELMNLATGDREVTLIHCIEDRLCVWRPYSLMELSYQVVLIEGHPDWSGRAKHSYGHLLFLDIASGVHDVRMLQIAHPEVVPHGVRCEGLLRVLSWVSFDLPAHLKGTVGALLLFFSVLRLCGSRQVVAHCCADERIKQMQLLCPALGSRKWSEDHYAVQSLVGPKKQEKPRSNKAKNTPKQTKPTKQQNQKREPWPDNSNGVADDASELRDLAQKQTQNTRSKRCPAKQSTQQRRNPGSPLPGSRRSRREALQA